MNTLPSLRYQTIYSKVTHVAAVADRHPRRSSRRRGDQPLAQGAREWMGNEATKSAMVIGVYIALLSWIRVCRENRNDIVVRLVGRLQTNVSPHKSPL